MAYTFWLRKGRLHLVMTYLIAQPLSLMCVCTHVRRALPHGCIDRWCAELPTGIDHGMLTQILMSGPAVVNCWVDWAL
jgi:hypothetical protein